jgi:hypothetical protein
LDVAGEQHSVNSILPTSAFDRSPVTGQPEKRLLLALLEGAVSDFQKYATASSGRGRRLFFEANAWFKSDATDRLVDFVNICQVLALDPSFVRGGLQRWRTARRSETTTSIVHTPFRRISGTRHTISLAS